MSEKSGKKRTPNLFQPLIRTAELLREAVVTKAFMETRLPSIEMLGSRDIIRSANAAILQINQGLLNQGLQGKNLSIGNIDSLFAATNKNLLAARTYHDKVIAPNIKGFNSIIDQLTTIYKDWARQNAEMIREATKPLKSLFDESDEEMTESARFLAAHKWPFPFDADVSAIYRICQEADKSKRPHSTLSKLLVRYFESHEGGSSWRPTLSSAPNFIQRERIKIICDCEESMQAKHGTVNFANLAIPALIAQIDGIKSEFMISKGFYLGRRKFKDNSNNDVEWKDELRIGIDSNDDPIDGLAADILMDTLFQSALPNETLTTWQDWNRHKIMHGQSYRYGRKDNAYRSFLLAGYLFKLN